ncbi:MAG: response regulator transcription factor [Solirubrobacterales bacterium]|nr:response regulator transcription factor [Solirubrobacterales bacterium]
MIIVVEDDAHLGALILNYLQSAGFSTVWVRSGEEALSELERHPVRLVVLDIGLPGMDGFELCRRIDGRVPVIMVTARDEVQDRIGGLELGADDYVPKPFSPGELVARVKAVLRRAGPEGPDPKTSTLGPVTVAHDKREVRVGDQPVELTQREFDLLEHLLLNAGRVVTREQLLSEVWGFEAIGETRTVEVHVAQLRKKLGSPELIQTVRGIGYKAVA